ncbi:MAG TPA: BsuBI/PstI family type II restriction endonuclease [Pirellulaceae bacterium]|nr:BsuBI/PstI family type II restriction endonuclease [Pirellulaceae bacterium]
MSKPNEALEILKRLGLPKQQQNDRSCLTLLALAGLREDDSWSKAGRPLLRIWDIMGWMRDHYDKDYAANSRETIRRQTIHQFEQARLINRNPDAPARPTNSGDTVYQLTAEAAKVLKRFGKRDFAQQCQSFIEQHGSLSAAYDRARAMHKVPVTLPNGAVVELSPGVHNELQRLIVEDFAPRFAPGAVVLYLGDTADKRLVIETALLKRLNIPKMSHDKLPDVLLYEPQRQWLFLVEAVTSHGPVSPKRHAELEAALRGCAAGRVYVTAFMDFTAFKKYASEIVWESEVWIAECPDHMIHFNGDKFLGPYPQRSTGDASH